MQKNTTYQSRLKSKSPSSQAGFTVMEIMVVLTIIAFLLFGAMKALNKFNGGGGSALYNKLDQLKSATTTYANDMGRLYTNLNALSDSNAAENLVGGNTSVKWAGYIEGLDQTATGYKLDTLIDGMTVDRSAVTNVTGWNYYAVTTNATVPPEMAKSFMRKCNGESTVDYTTITAATQGGVTCFTSANVIATAADSNVPVSVSMIVYRSR